MGRLSDDLRSMGYVPTGEESPVCDDGELWANSHEMICDESGVVIDGDHHGSTDSDSTDRYEYRNSGRVKLIGGFLSSYDWGHDGDEFNY